MRSAIANMVSILHGIDLVALVSMCLPCRVIFTNMTAFPQRKLATVKQTLFTVSGIQYFAYVGCYFARTRLYHSCQVLRKSKSETASAPLIFAYKLVIERMEKSGAQVLRVRFFPLFNRHKLLRERQAILFCPTHIIYYQ